MRPSDIADLMHNVVLELSQQAREKTLRILTDIQREPLIVECDPNRMVQLFTNLIENAIRFSRKDGLIGVHVRTINRLSVSRKLHAPRITSPKSYAGFALIGVSDSGPRHRNTQKEIVFHMFHQLRQGKKSPAESLGLGLAISARLSKRITPHVGRGQSVGRRSVLRVAAGRPSQTVISPGFVRLDVQHGA